MRLVTIITSVIALSIFVASPARAAEVKNHPAITPYEGSVATRRDDDGYRLYSLVTAVNEKGQTDEEVLQSVQVEGKVSRLAYENPKNRSAHEIYVNYREGLEKGGFNILFACADKECGPSFATSRWSRVTGLRYVGPDQRYIAAKATKDGQDVYVAIVIAKLRHQIEVVEVTQMEKGLVSARIIGEGLMKDGRVVLEGIYFDTDKATIKAESKEALDAIAQFLKDNPQQNAFIVGHTDSTGGFDHNMTLSKARAESVVVAMTRTYGVEPKRLGSYGVGPLSPRKSNVNEGGRAENRRVEMVQR